MPEPPKIAFFQNNARVKEIDFGVVPVGETKVITVIVKNIGSIEIFDLVFDKGHPDVKILKAPKRLGAQQEKQLILEYKPLFQISKGMRAKIKVRGVYIV